MGQKRFLYVEGTQDIRVLEHVCMAHGINIDPKIPPDQRAFEVRPREGFETLRKVVKEALKGSEGTHIGVVVDADQILDGQHWSGRWASIRQLFAENGYECPAEPKPDGMVVHQDESPTVGLWVMPDNIGPGKIETFMSALVPGESPLWLWAVESVKHAPGCEERFAEKDREKAEVHTYLAVQKQPGTPMGGGITKHYFDANAELALRFVAWLRAVFEL